MLRLFRRNTPYENYLKWVIGKGDENLLCFNVVLKGYRRALDRFRVLPLDQLRSRPLPHPLSQCAGIYFLWFGPALVYVGKSRNVIARIAQHRKGGKEFTRASCIVVQDDLCRAIERIYISRYRPCDNVLL